MLQPSWLRAMFLEHLAQDRFADNDPDALVFVSLEGSTMSHTNFYKRHFKPAVRRSLSPAAQTLRFHDLRHTCAALLIAAGAHPKTIQEQLGHSSIQVTMDVYGSLLPSVAEALEAALDEKYPAPRARANVVPLRR